MTTEILATPELNLLLAAARHLLHGGDGLDVSARVDPDRLLAAADRHGMTAILERAASTAVEFPQTLADRIRETTRLQVPRTLMITTQLRQVIDLLRAHDIAVLPVKGPVLAATVYGDVALRGVSVDLDFVVRPADFSRALGLILDAGYQRVEMALDEHDVESWDEEAHLLPHGRGVMVELHTDLIGNVGTVPVDLEAVLGRTRNAPLFGTTIPLIDAEDLLLYLCLHGARHIFRRLLWTCDVAFLIRANPNLQWDRLIDRAAGISARQRLSLGLYLAWQWFGAAVPDSVRQELFRSRTLALRTALVARRVAETAEGKDVPGIVSRFLCEMTVRETGGQRRAYLLRQLTPNAWDRAWIRLPRSLAWLRYALRPIRLLTRYGVNPRGK